MAFSAGHSFSLLRPMCTDSSLKLVTPFPPPFLLPPPCPFVPVFADLFRRLVFFACMLFLFFDSSNGSCRVYKTRRRAPYITDQGAREGVEAWPIHSAGQRFFRPTTGQREPSKAPNTAEVYKSKGAAPTHARTDERRDGSLSRLRSENRRHHCSIDVFSRVPLALHAV